MAASVTPFLWLLIGAWIGAPLGYFTAALLFTAAHADAHLDATQRANQELAPARAINLDNWSNE